ncbi:unnamed protein product [Cyclocybe aegerita]|uniref:FAD-binding domain-containing protein n=1 Tax=Cyclocybe aegerita TaxID=1973307 RepID=A0A8S0XFK8_CYCAE|nr:unnamed protein product [Cyclocybe aegerita]
MSSSSKPTVIIVGAGLGGLTLAQSLRTAGIPYRLFERDSSEASRQQGWSLLLHECLPALRKIAPPSAPPIECISVTYQTPYEDHFHMFNGHTKEVYLSFEGPVFADAANKRDAYSISASRSKFRAWLTHNLEVNWDHAFKGYEVLPSGRVKAYFENGVEVEGDILVGADGSQSKVRSQLFAGNPAGNALNRLPHACVAGLVHLPRDKYLPHMKYGPSLYTTDGVGLRVFIGLRTFSPDMSTATLVWLLFWVEKQDKKEPPAKGETEKPTLTTLHMATPAELLAYAKQATADLHADFREIFEETKVEDMLGSLVLYDREPMHCPAGPITIIGDAMHVMSPFRGEGGNAALTDAFELSEAIVNLSSSTITPEAINTTLRTYEEKMIPRGTDMVVSSRNAGKEFGTRGVTEKLFNRAELGELVQKH